MTPATMHAAAPAPGNDDRVGIVLFAHGSRDPLWRAPIEAVADRVRAQHSGGAAEVRCAYLELTEPDLPTAVRELAALGLRRIRILPMFLGVGRHAREDLPLLMQALHRAHPQVRFDLRPAVGEDPRLLDLLARIAAD